MKSNQKNQKDKSININDLSKKLKKTHLKRIPKLFNPVYKSKSRESIQNILFLKELQKKLNELQKENQKKFFKPLEALSGPPNSPHYSD